MLGAVVYYQVSLSTIHCSVVVAYRKEGMRGIIGKKLGMTQVFGEGGEPIPVTVIEAGPCPIVRVKSSEKDGYDAVLLGFGDISRRRVNEAQRGMFRRANLEPKRVVREFRVDSPEEVEIGQVVDVGIFTEGERVKVTGCSKGKGFAGVVKRHGFRGGPKTHGQSNRHRAPGSIGASSDPSRVWKGQPMAGRMGGKRVTVRNLSVVRVDPEQHILLVKGAVPGPTGGYLLISKLKDG